MAVGFPVKDDYATGDVLTAANMNDFAGTLNTVPTFAGNVNPVLNSAFQVAQRGTTFSSIQYATYTLDRWQSFRGSGAFYSVSQQATSDTTNLPFIQYCARVGRPSGNTETDAVFFTQQMESLNSIPFAGKTVTFSFYARKGADFSSPSSALTFKLAGGTGTNQNYYSGFTGVTDIISTSGTLTTTWQRFTATATIGATITQLATVFQNGVSGTAGAADYFEVTGVQIDVGSTALPFRTYAGTIQGELAACQRYYFRLTTGSGFNFSRFGNGTMYGDTAGSIVISFPVTMRTHPTALDQSGTASDYAIINSIGGVNALTSVPTVDVNSNNVANVNANFNTGSTAAGQATQLLANNNQNAYLGWSAEL
jgi:hypothetical protein